MVREVVPQLLEHYPHGTERTIAETNQPTAEIPVKNPNNNPDERMDEALIAELLEYESLFAQWAELDVPVGAFISSFLSQKMQKELRHTGNDPALQEQTDDSKVVEWKTLENKKVVRVIPPKLAKKLRENHPNRFMQSRLVIVNKLEDAGETTRIKSRRCLRGYLDPDLMTKVRSGDCHSPTMSTLGRSLLFQLIVSNKWTLAMGDIKGAFLEAGPIAEKYKPLYSELPTGGILGIVEGSIIEILSLQTA